MFVFFSPCNLSIYILFSCTGGIRCERATALLNQMSTINPNKLKPNGVYHCQGGIERYVKTYPKGGYFKGKNYLFDKRMEQIPGGEGLGEGLNGEESMGNDTTTTNIDAKCCLCRCSYTQYRGQYKCNRSLCGVPVIVCDTCRLKTNAINPDNLICELCREGHRIVTPKNFDLIAQKRKAEEIYDANCALKEEKDDDEAGGKKFKKPKQDQKLQQEEQDPTEEPLSKTTKKKIKDTLKAYHTDRLFLRRLPLTVTFSKIRRALFVAGNDSGSGRDNNNNSSDDNNKNNKAMSTQIVGCRWLVDKKYNAFYGSCIIQLSNEHIAKQILKRSKTSKPSGGANGGGIKIDKKKIKVELEFKKDPNHNVVCVAEQGGVVKEEEIFGQDEYPPLGKVREN